MPGGQHESIAVRPVRVRRVVSHDAREQHVCERSERHRRTGMAGFRFLDGVHRKRSDRIDGEEIEIVRWHEIGRRRWVLGARY